jgi:predicted RNase H-like HicB family nuclease
VVSLSVSIHEDPSGKYVARIDKSDTFRRPLVTEGETGQELFEMVNDAVFTALDIPEQYRDYMTVFAPPPEIRDQFGIKIPKQYLDKDLGLVKV